MKLNIMAQPFRQMENEKPKRRGKKANKVRQKKVKEPWAFLMFLVVAVIHSSFIYVGAHSFEL